MSDEQTRIGINPQSSGPATPPKASLTVIRAGEAGAQGKRYPLAGEFLTLGRGEDNTVVVRSDEASRQHARIFVLGCTHILVDMDSTNGTQLNGAPVKEHTLRHGDVIGIADTELRYERDEQSRGS